VSPAGEWTWKRSERGRCPANWTAYGGFLLRCYSDPAIEKFEQAFSITGEAKLEAIDQVVKGLRGKEARAGKAN
jgi:hypothetical protein